MDFKAFGRRVKLYRTKLDMTQEELSEILDVTVEHLCRIENGNCKPSIQLIERLGKTLNVSEKELLFGNQNGAENRNGISDKAEFLSEKDLNAINQIIESLVK